MIVYFNGNYVLLDDVKLSPFDRGFLFADGVYEVLRTYNGKLFRFESHIKRLKYSLNQLCIKFNDFDILAPISYNLAEMNNLSKSDFSVYIQITRGYQFPRMHLFQENINPTIFVYLNKLKDNSNQLEKGVKVILSEDIRWTKCDIKSIALLPSVLAKAQANNSGAYETLFYRNNKITEGSHTNFFGVKGNVIYTAPLSNYILEGITREVIIELCNQNNIKLIEDYIDVNDLKLFNEFFITGTTTEITPVVQINDWVVGNGLPQKTTRFLQQYFSEFVNSNN
jgi:D-alanine transaminase